MRVLLASPGLAVGGAERVVLQLAGGLARRGHEVTVSGPTGPLEDELATLGTGRVELPERGRSPVGAAGGALRLARAVRRLRPDVVHGHNVKATVLAATAARLAMPRDRARLVATFHGVTPEEDRLAARLLRPVDAIACVSADLRRRLAAQGLTAAKLHLVHNAVAAPPAPDAAGLARLDAELGLGAGPVVLAVGRLVEQKRHDRLVEAARLLRDQGRPVTVLVAGEGPLRPELEARVRAAGLEGRFRLLGVRRDVGALLGRADVLAFSSDWEGLSIAALEGLAAGTPLVTTPVEGMRLLVGDGRAGRIAADMTPGALAAALGEVLGAPGLRAAMGAAAEELARSSFGLEPMLDAYEALYRP